MKLRNRPYWRAVALIAALTLVATACGGGDGAGNDDGGQAAQPTATEPADAESPTDDGATADPREELVACAEEEGTVVYYSSEVEAINEEVARLFEEKYDISVEILRLASSPLSARFAEEKNAGTLPADVLRTADGAIFVENPEWFEELSPELIPMLAEYPDDVYNDNNTAVLTQYSTYTINYNTDLLAEDEAPTTWPEIIDPKWSGEIVLSDPRASISWLALFGALRDAHGIEFLEEFANTVEFDLVDSASPGAQQVAAGAYQFNFPAFPGHATPVIEEGAPVSSVQPTDPTPLKPDNIALVAGASNPCAARLLVDFRLSEEALQASCRLNDIAVALPDIEGCLPLPDDPADRLIVKDVWTDEESQPIFDALGLRN